MAAYLGYTADEDAVLWLTSDQLWLMTRIREEEEKEDIGRSNGAT